MTPTECGFANPPADGTPDREIIDRFRDFLAIAPPPLRVGADGYTHPDETRTSYLDGVSPARRWRIAYLAWKLVQPVDGMDLDPAWRCDNCRHTHRNSEPCR